MKFERLLVNLPHILGEKHALNVSLQSPQLKVVFAFVIGDDWDGVVKLIGVGVGRVINKDHLRHLPVDNP